MVRLQINLPTVAAPTVRPMSPAGMQVRLMHNLPAVPTATKLAFSQQPGGGQAGVVFPIQPIVQAQNVSNALAFTYTGPVTLTGVGCTLIGTTTVACVGGVATFPNIGVAGGTANGSYTIVASASGLTGATSSSFAVAAPVATSLVFHTQPDGAAKNTAFGQQPIVYILDQFGGLFNGTNAITITRKTGTGDNTATLGGTTTTSAVAGAAVFTDLQLDKIARGYQLTASASGLPSVDSAAFLVDAVYVQRDFVPGKTLDLAVPLATPRTASPGPGALTINDVQGSRNFVQRGELRALSQDYAVGSPAWGKDTLINASHARQQGRCFVLTFIPEDFTIDYAFLLSPTTSVNADPATLNGIGIKGTQGGLDIMTQLGVMHMDTVQTAWQNHQYMLVVVEQSTGWLLYLSSAGAESNLGSAGIFCQPALYPNARLTFVDSRDTTSTFYALLSFLSGATYYPDGHAIKDVRVVDVATWNSRNTMTAAWDSFTDTTGTNITAHTANKGGAWATELDDSSTYSATWTIQSNTLQTTAGGGAYYHTYQAGAPSDNCVYSFKATMPASGTPIWGMLLRRTDNANHMRVDVNGSTVSIKKLVAGTPTTLSGAAASFTFAPSTTYAVQVYVKGNTYRVIINNTVVIDTYADAGNTFLAANGGAGFVTNLALSAGVQFSDWAVYPLDVALPVEITIGDGPVVLTGGTTLGSDGFAGTVGTSITAHTPTTGPAWSILNGGAWSLDGSGHLQCTAVPGSYSVAVQDLGTADVEASTIISIPTQDTATSVLESGIALRVAADGSSLIGALILRTPLQIGNDEIEIHMIDATVNSIVAHKVQIGPYYPATGASGSVTLVLQIKGTLLHVFLDGALRASFEIPPYHPSGTRHGYYYDHNEVDALKFGTWIVKAL